MREATITYEVKGNYFSEPAEFARVGIAPQPAPEPFFYSFTGPIDGVAGGDSTVVIDEIKDGVVVGSATLSGITTMVIPDGPAGPYSENGFASSLTIVGEFDAYACFASRTRIRTPGGDVAVEKLVEGDLVVLAGGGTAPVVWIGHRRQIGGTVIRVRAHALAPHVPAADLIVSADHALFVDGVLIPAGLLVDHDSIVVERLEAVTFWHIELARHAILLAEGAPAESFLDTGNRRQFSNCPLACDPVEAAEREPCAEMVLAGPVLRAIRDRLRASALA